MLGLFQTMVIWSIAFLWLRLLSLLPKALTDRVKKAWFLASLGCFVGVFVQHTVLD